jgi:FecR protein
METDRTLMKDRCSLPGRLLSWLLIVAVALSGCATPPGDKPVAGKNDYATVTGVAMDNRAAASPDPTVAALWRDNAWIAIKPGQALQRGDVVQTGPRGALVIAYGNGSVLYVGAGSRGRIGSFTELVGRVFVKVKGLFEVETTFVKAGAKGTAYEVVSTADGGARVTVVEGVVELSSRSAAWPAVALGAGTRATAYPQAPVPSRSSRGSIRSNSCRCTQAPARTSRRSLPWPPSRRCWRSS